MFVNVEEGSVQVDLVFQRSFVREMALSWTMAPGMGFYLFEETDGKTSVIKAAEKSLPFLLCSA